jgi:hypothetical protein
MRRRLLLIPLAGLALIAGLIGSPRVAHAQTPPSMTVAAPHENEGYAGTTATIFDNIGGTATAYGGATVNQVWVGIASHSNPAACTINTLNPLSRVSWLETLDYPEKWGCAPNDAASNEGVVYTGLNTPNATWAWEPDATELALLSPTSGGGDYELDAYVEDSNGLVTQYTTPENTAGLIDFTYAPVASSADLGYVTILFGRAQWETMDESCNNVNANTKTLGNVGTYLNGLGYVADAETVIDYAQDATNGTPCQTANDYATWAQLSNLASNDGWGVTSETLDYPTPYSALEGDAAAETTGTKTTLASEGFGASDPGMLSYPDNLYYDSGGTAGSNTPVQVNNVEGNFSWGRTYAGFRDTEDGELYEGFQSTFSVNGGAVGTCDAQFNCTGYDSPTELEQQVAVLPANTWTSVQFYKFVTGSGSFMDDHQLWQWNCTGAASTHYTWTAEVYCYNDFQSFVGAIGEDNSNGTSSFEVTTPTVVGAAWGQ